VYLSSLKAQIQALLDTLGEVIRSRKEKETESRLNLDSLKHWIRGRAQISSVVNIFFHSFLTLECNKQSEFMSFFSLKQVQTQL
jgi:ribosomal protein S16